MAKSNLSRLFLIKIKKKHTYSTRLKILFKKFHAGHMRCCNSNTGRHYIKGRTGHREYAAKERGGYGVVGLRNRDGGQGSGRKLGQIQEARGQKKGIGG